MSVSYTIVIFYKTLFWPTESVENSDQQDSTNVNYCGYSVLKIQSYVLVMKISTLYNRITSMWCMKKWHDVHLNSIVLASGKTMDNHIHHLEKSHSVLC